MQSILTSTNIANIATANSSISSSSVKTATILNPPMSPNIPSISSEEEYDTYLSIAYDLGLENKQLTIEKMRQVFAENNYTVYNNDNVSAYLEDKGQYNWAWYGIRQKDIDAKLETLYSSISNTKEIYSKKIPLRILEKIQIINNAVPESLFFISDSSAMSTVHDIFLMVTGSSRISFYICDYWNEAEF